MANPALKNGYFSIANELAEKLAAISIAGGEMRILWVVLRQTWAWDMGNGRKKEDDWISYGQFVKKTGLSRRSCIYSVKHLVNRRILIKVGKRLKFNQNYEEWDGAKNCTSASSGKGVVLNLAPTKETLTKENKRKEFLLFLDEDKRYKLMKTYNENNHQDEGIEIIDVESGERVKAKGDTKVGKVMWKLLEWAVKEKRGGQKFSNVIVQFRALNKLFSLDVPPQAIQERWNELEQSDFYKKIGIDFNTIVKSFDKKPYARD